MMFRVELTQTVIEKTEILVEADDTEQANDRAWAKVMHDGEDVVWEFARHKDAPEVIAVVPLRPVPVVEG
jgi:hypothetical protein